MERSKSEGAGATEEPSNTARRRLLKLGVYAAPVVLGTLTLSKNAWAASCPPSPCTPLPCSPDPCGPDPCNPNPCNPDPCGPG